MASRRTWALILLLAASPAAAAPISANRDLTGSFYDRVRQNETSFLNSAHDVCAGEGCGFQETNRWLVDNQLRAVGRAATTTFQELYGMRGWQRALLSPTDIQSAGVAALVGGALLYADGLRGHLIVDGWRLGVRVAAGRRMRGQADAGSLEVARQGLPLTLSAAFGRQAPSLGLRYALRY